VPRTPRMTSHRLGHKRPAHEPGFVSVSNDDLVRARSCPATIFVGSTSHYVNVGAPTRGWNSHPVRVGRTLPWQDRPHRGALAFALSFSVTWKIPAATTIVTISATTWMMGDLGYLKVGEAILDGPLRRAAFRSVRSPQDI